MDNLRISGRFILVSSARSIDGVLYAQDGAVYFESKDGQTFSDLEVLSIQGDENVLFKTGSYFKSDHKLPQLFVRGVQTRTKRSIAWLEKFTIFKALVLLAMVVGFLIVFRLALTSASHAIAAIVPSGWEQVIGKNAYLAMKDTIFEDSELTEDRQASISLDARRIANVIDDSEEIEIHFHLAPVFGANALAFPGGPIVVTDDLVNLLDHDQLLAVLAHEYAHIEHRHHLQQIAEIVGLSVLAYLLFGVDDGVTEEIVAVMINLWSFSLSRDFEKQADLTAVEYLTEVGVDPDHLVIALEKLTETECIGEDSSISDPDCAVESANWFSTHPSGAERIGYLRNAISN